MENMKKKIIFVLSIILFIIIFINYSFLKSTLVMYFYSKSHENNSIMKANNFTVHIPGGFNTPERDWYPFVMVFNDNGFSKKIHDNIQLTILYNFGAFENGKSNFYNEDSQYYSAFYGAYLVKYNDSNKIYGIKNGDINEQQLEQISKYDISTLVLKSIGCPYDDVHFILDNEEKNVFYIDSKGWIKADAHIISRSPLHRYKRNYQAYIQYGKPPHDYTGEEFEKIDLYGRMYCKYFQEYGCTILLYIIGPDKDMINNTDTEILSKTKIHGD